MEIFFSTPHGNFKITKWHFNQNLRDLCSQNKIPHQSVSFYGKRNDNITLLIGLEHPLNELASTYQSIYIKADRNIDYNTLVNKLLKVKSVKNPTSEYTFPSECGKELYHFELSQQACRKYVINEVSKFFINEASLNSKKIVLGISGGGDSNTLIMSFLESGYVKKEQLIAVMMLGIPDWDKGKARAEAICNEHKIELQFVNLEQINLLLGKPKKRDWVEDFEKVFPDADLEVLGTHCIRLALSYIAKKENAQAVVTGLNLEDILAECFFATMRGTLPPPFPIRPIDGLTFWHPLYRIPKKIIDGCYPKYSLQNYNDRYPSYMLGRAIPYYLSQCIHGMLPGVEFDLLEGFKKISKLQNSYGIFDPELGFSTVDNISDKIREKWKKFINCN